MSVYRPKDKQGNFTSPFYQFDFQLKGRRFHGSTERTTKREAKAVEDEQRARASAALAKEATTDPTEISLVWGRFWDERGQHDKKATTTFYRMSNLQDGLSDILRDRRRSLVVGEIDDDIIASYVARRRGARSKKGTLLSPASINRELQILRRILRRAVKVWKMHITLPAWDELFFPEADELVVDMTQELEGKILENMREDFRPAARFLVMSGLRLSNALPLQRSCIDFEQDLLIIRQKSKKPGGRLHVLPITRPMKILLANEIGNHDDYVFTYVSQRTRDGKVRGQRYPLLPETFYNVFKSAAAAAGKPDLRPHDLRHVAGTRTLRHSGGNLRAAQRHLGHSRISTTTKYAHYMVDELRAAMNAAHSPEKSPEARSPDEDNDLKKLAKS